MISAAITNPATFTLLQHDMTLSDPPDGMMVVEYSSIRISSDEIAEIDQDTALVKIPRSEIQRVELCYGQSSEPPIVQLVVGLALIAAGGNSAKAIWLWLCGDGTLHIVHIHIGAVVLSLLAVWLLRIALRRGHYLRIGTKKEAWKLSFRGKLERQI